MNQPTRPPETPRTWPLSGRHWQLCPDPYNRGLAEAWGEQPPAGEPWVPAIVPGTIQHSLGADFRGVAWYRLNTSLPDGWTSIGGDERLRLRVEAAATDARAWVNGRFIGRHAGDFIPFEFDATEALLSRGGEIELLIRVDQVHAPRPSPGVITEHGHPGKGFHDVLSLQHAGLWGDVTLRRTGRTTIRPNGLCVRATPDRIVIEVEFEQPCGEVVMPFTVVDHAGRPIAGGAIEPEAGSTGATFACEGEHAPAVALDPWSPDAPTLYTLSLHIASRDRPREAQESHVLRFGVREVALGGPRHRRILLNGSPIQVRGVLHWGHEPDHIAPAPPADQVRAEFAELKLRGFNAVCLCMVYMPDHYYDLADQMGMLLWQEHPVWKSPMGDELLPEYRRLYSEYFRRDRRHPSVVIVSGSCEHEMLNPRLGRWWWETARKELPRTLAQVQTAFFAWSDPGLTDLYDEHVYDNSGRWIDYLRDARSAINRLPDPCKPFIMGETIITNAWPNIQALEAARRQAAMGDEPTGRAASPGSCMPASPWWISRGLDACAAIERDIQRRWGTAALEPFKRRAHRHALNMRSFQSERLRSDPDHAGWVMNHLRDVPACRCGFMDDLGRWRFEPHELRPFLSDAALILETPGHFRSLTPATPAAVTIHLCNFSTRDLDARAAIDVVVSGRTAARHTIPLKAPRGSVASAPLTLGLFEADRPTPVVVRARADGIPENDWTLWILPRPGHAPPLFVHDADPFTHGELALDFEERKYSSGWGLACLSWRPVVQVPAEIFPDAPRWADGHAPPPKPAVVVTHRLTRGLIDHVLAGGRALLLASRASGGMSAENVMHWAGVPLVVEDGPDGIIPDRGGDAAIDLLHFDLTRRAQRMVPTAALGLTQHVNPAIRFIKTHDLAEPAIYDAVFTASVGRGVLAVSSLDHQTPAGRWLLGRILRQVADGPPPEAAIPAEVIKRFEHAPAGSPR
ncbi:MAG: hypothetical protein KF787_13795 [Phycisphaeraceae bacterium]|nr:hypothetical protein [Phycisphaerae bacterium]MBX3393708.1 hypothetical protein [Phycisphaeraceae bacterium]